MIYTVGKVLGEWLISLDSVKQIKSNPFMTQPLPQRFAPFFPEYLIKNLNAGQYRTTVICRILEFGNLNDIRWLINRYGRKDIKNILARDGGRLLSSRAKRLWSLFFDVKIKTPKNRLNSPWNQRGQLK
jgi:hypothetical protein